MQAQVRCESTFKKGTIIRYEPGHFSKRKYSLRNKRTSYFQITFWYRGRYTLSGIFLCCAPLAPLYGNSLYWEGELWIWNQSAELYLITRRYLYPESRWPASDQGEFLWYQAQRHLIRPVYSGFFLWRWNAGKMYQTTDKPTGSIAKYLPLRFIDPCRPFT